MTRSQDALDLDYIVRWMEPTRSERYFTFWLSPATLVFEGAWDIKGQLGPLHEALEIADIHRLDAAAASQGQAILIWLV